MWRVFCSENLDEYFVGPKIVAEHWTVSDAKTTASYVKSSFVLQSFPICFCSVLFICFFYLKNHSFSCSDTMQCINYSMFFTIIYYVTVNVLYSFSYFFFLSNVSCYRYEEYFFFSCRLFHLPCNKYRSDALFVFMFLCVCKNTMWKYSFYILRWLLPFSLRTFSYVWPQFWNG